MPGFDQLTPVRPPRERPSPWSSGSTLMPPGGSFCGSFFVEPAACW